MKQEVLRLERVTYRSEGVNILDNFSFHIAEGEIMGLQPLDNDGLDELLDIIQNNPPLYFGASIPGEARPAPRTGSPSSAATARW